MTCQFGWKMPNHVPFWGGVEPLKIVGSLSKPQKAHPWVRKRHLKRLKSVQGCNAGAIARKKYNQNSTAQDMTTKSHKKRNISHIWRQAPH